METNPSVEYPIITLDVFDEITKNLNIVYGQIVHVEKIPKSKKLLILTVYFGEEIREKTIVTNIGNKYTEADLISLTFPFILNFPPMEIAGTKSEGMIILPTLNGEIQLENISIGSKLFG